MIMLVIKLHDIVSIGDGYGPAFVEGLAAPPSRSSSSADVMSHEAVVSDHQDVPPVQLCEGRESVAKTWKQYCMFQFHMCNRRELVKVCSRRM